MDHRFGRHKEHDFARTTFNTYEVISPCNVRLDDDSVAKAIRMGPLLLELKQEA